MTPEIDHPMFNLMRDGTIATDPRLGRLVQDDPSNRRFRAVGSVVSADAPFKSALWNLTAFLDQGAEGACVGFGTTHELLADPVPVAGLDATFAREKIYWEAQKDDPWEGGAYPGAQPFYEGTSTLAGIKAAEKLGYFPEYRWAFTLDDMRRVIGNYGPMVIGVNWYSGMFDTDSAGYIHVSGYIAGGHCLLVVGIDEEHGCFILHNSWGPAWGVTGRAKISFDDMARLLSEEGEAAVLVTRADPGAVEPEPVPFEPEPPIEPEEPASSQNFFRKTNSFVVHDSHKGIRRDIWYATVAEAIADGCRPCKRCKPTDE
jgi:hypothetical protein